MASHLIGPFQVSSRKLTDGERAILNARTTWRPNTLERSSRFVAVGRTLRIRLFGR